MRNVLVPGIILGLALGATAGQPDKVSTDGTYLCSIYQMDAESVALD